MCNIVVGLVCSPRKWRIELVLAVGAVSRRRLLLGVFMIYGCVWERMKWSGASNWCFVRVTRKWQRVRRANTVALALPVARSYPADCRYRTYIGETRNPSSAGAHTNAECCGGAGAEAAACRCIFRRDSRNSRVHLVRRENTSRSIGAPDYSFSFSLHLVPFARE